MNLSKILVDLRKNMKRVKRVFFVSLALLVVIDLAVPRHHVEFFWDVIPGFSALYGFISCALLIIVSKWLGDIWLTKPEDYYEKLDYYDRKESHD